MDSKYVSSLFFGLLFLLPLAWYGASLRQVSIAVIFFELLIIGGLMIRNHSLMWTREQSVFYLMCFVAHIGMLFYQSTYGDLPMSGGDSSVFHYHATEILRYAQDNILNILNPPAIMENRGDYYERLAALVYSFCGAKTQYMYYVSEIASELVFYYIVQTAILIIQDGRIAVNAALFFYVWPIEMVYSVDYLREMTIQFVFIYSLYCFLQYLLFGKSLRLLLAFSFAYLATGIHSGMFGVLAAYAIVLVFFDKNKQLMTFSMTKFVLIIGVFLIFAASPLWGEVMGRFSNIDSPQDIINKTSSVVATTDYIGAPSSSFGIILQTPLRLFFFVLSPLIWQVRSAGTAIALVLDGFPRLYLVYNIYRNWKWRGYLNQRNKMVLLVLLIIILCSHLIFSWGTNNYGTAMRHRLKVFPAEIILMYVIKECFYTEDEADVV